MNEQQNNINIYNNENSSNNFNGQTPSNQPQNQSNSQIPTPLSTQSINNNQQVPPQKNNNKIFLILGIVLAIIIVVIILCTTIFSTKNNNSDDTNNTNNTNNKISSEIEYFYDEDNEFHKYTIKKMDINEDYITNEVGKALLVIDEKNNQIKNLIVDPDYKFYIENKKYGHYIIKLIENVGEMTNNIEINGNEYTYRFKIYFRIIDPKTMFNKFKFKGNVNQREFFMTVYNEPMTKYLNNYILDYIKDNESKEINELPNSNIHKYLKDKISNNEAFYSSGVEITEIKLLEIKEK